MKIFISWSGERSKAVANLLKVWVKCVLQAADPWISTVDIDRGARWRNEITKSLGQAVTGIICITQENKSKPWLNFESGALAIGAQSERVCTFLIDLSFSDVEGPLSEFNHTLPTRDGVQALVHTLNKLLKEPLDDQTLAMAFDAHWPMFHDQFRQILESPGTTVVPRTPEQLLTEILENTRTLQNQIAELNGNQAKLNDVTDYINRERARNALGKLNPAMLELFPSLFTDQSPAVAPEVRRMLFDYLTSPSQKPEEPKDKEKRSPK